jgi:hypothetical protein
MAEVVITKEIQEKINQKFRGESIKVFELIYSLKDNPKKGKSLGSIGEILIKELKYKNFRFYFLVEGFKLKILNEEELTDLLIRFVRMSDKKHQQTTIDEIKRILIKIGPKWF